LLSHTYGSVLGFQNILLAYFPSHALALVASQGCQKIWIFICLKVRHKRKLWNCGCKLRSNKHNVFTYEPNLGNHLL
jgi:ABC-type phosphonate transport system ATPase subunit